MAEPLTWMLKLEAEFDGATKLSVALKDAEGGLQAVGSELKNAEAASRSADDEIKALRDTLAQLKKPGQIGRLKEEIAAFGHAAAASEHEHADAIHHTSEEQHGHADAVHHVSDAYHKHSHETLGVGAALRETKGRAHEFLEAIGAVAAFEVMEKGIDIIRELGAEMLNAAAGAERLDKSFEMSLGIEGGKEAVEYAEKIGKFENSEFTGKQMKGFESTLIRAGVSLKEIDKYMAAAADTASKAENPIEGMEGAVSALARAAMSGNLDGRSLRRMFIGIPQLRELDEFKNKSDAQMKAILSSGTLTLDQIFHAIAGKDHVLGDLAVKMTGTMSSQLTHLRNLPDEFFEKLDHSQGYEHLKTKFGEVLESLDPEGPVGSKIFGALEAAFTSVADAATGIDFEKIAGTLTDDVIPEVGKIVKALAEVDWTTGVEGMLTLLKAGAKIVDGLWDAFQKAGDVALWLTGQTKGDQDRQKIQSAAEDKIPRSINKAVMEETGGEKPETPISAEIARSIYENTKSTREHRLFGGGEPDAIENYQAAMAQAMEESEAAGPKEIRARPKKSEWREKFEKPDVAEGPAAEEGAASGAYKMFDLGKDAGAGYPGGVREAKPDAFAAGQELPASTADGVQKHQESHSPSLLFRKLGRFGGQGYAEGIGDSEGMAEEAGRSMVEAAMDGAGDADGNDQAGSPLGADGNDQAGSPLGFAPAGGTPAASARPIEINVNIDLGGVGAGKSGSDHADALIAKLRAEMPGVFQGLAEQLAIEAGV